MQAYLALHAADIEGAQSLLDRARAIAVGATEPTIGVRVDLMNGIFGVVKFFLSHPYTPAVLEMALG